MLVIGPTFGEYERAARLGGAVVHTLGTFGEVNYSQIASEIATHAPRLAFLCHPNNPTGFAWDTQRLGSLIGTFPNTLFVNVNGLAQAAGLAVLDQASQRIPVVLDGVICTAAALIAQQINPDVTHYLIAGHCGAEPGHALALAHLELAPLLALDLRLGEGTGAVLALPLLEAAMRTLNEMGELDVG